MNKKQIHRMPLSVIAGLLIFTATLCAATDTTLPDQDRTRLAEAFRIADTIDNRLWNNWGTIPFPVLLITEETEFLLRHPSPDSTFSASGYDSLLQTEIYTRPRTYPLTLLASFPFCGAPTTVIGQAENTEAKTSTPWVITLLHEHFHQFQDSHSGYYDEVDKLDLSGGDQTGMWMLNYAFPYESEALQPGFDEMKNALGNAVNAPDSTLHEAFAAYCKARHAFMTQLNDSDRKYYSFQLWQEGVARYTEYRVAEWAANNYRPTAAFQKLADYTPLADLAALQLNLIRNAPFKVSMSQFQRMSFYLIGASEAYLLDRVNPAWRDGYFTQMLTLDPYFEVGSR